ncbi:MAG: hypothetical protein ACP6IY_02850 [Promethearchaeia archaeon]
MRKIQFIAAYKKRKIFFSGILIVSIFVLNITLFAVIGVSTNEQYELNIERGSIIYEIEDYDKNTWKDSIGDTQTPGDFFKGSADDIGATGKYLIKGFSESKWNMYDMLIEYFGVLKSMSMEDAQQFILMANFTEDDIINEYNNEYKVWIVIVAKWNFNSDDFEEEPDEDNLYIPVLKDPMQIKTILQNYNDWALKVKNIAIMMNLEPYTIFSGDEFFWQLISNNVPFASPIQNYMENIIKTLRINNTKIDGQTIQIEKKGNTNYIIEIEYNSIGIQSKIEFRNSENKVFYRITSSRSVEIALMLLYIILIVFLSAIVVITIWRKKIKSKRNALEV